MSFLRNFPFLKYEILGNRISQYLSALIVFIFLIFVFKFFQQIILKKLKKLAEGTKSDIDDEFIKIVESIKPPFYSFLAFYLSLAFLTINPFLYKVITAVLIVWIVYQAIIALQILINYIVRKKVQEEDQQSKTAVNVISIILKGCLWTLALLLVLSNLGVNITSLVAGLGIGGIAVALAVQNLLGDLFSSFAIYFDKPFLVGDFIIIGGNTMGTVEKIGVKTTRIRALQGEEVIVSNKELTSVKIQNFKKMKERRVVFQIGVVYETPLEKLKRIPKILEEIITQLEETRFDRAHFCKFGDFALVFEVSYYVLSPDYKKFMDINQEILFKIKEIFEKEEITMAYPTQTLYLSKVQ